MRLNPDTFNAALHIQIAADDIASLRQCDIGRLFDECHYDYHDILAFYIITHRPDLTNEVKAIQSEFEYEVA